MEEAIAAVIGVGLAVWAISYGTGHHHAWANWGEPFEKTQYRATGSFGDVGRYIEKTQSRTCERCGAVEDRTV